MSSLLWREFFFKLLYLRPYEGVKSNFIEIMNEIYFGFLLLFLSIINTKSEWDSTKTSIYMWVLLSNTLAVFVIIFGTASSKLNFIEFFNLIPNIQYFTFKYYFKEILLFYYNINKIYDI